MFVLFGMIACPLVVLACESLHVCTVCIWRCEHARFCVEVFYALYINFHSFILVLGWLLLFLPSKMIRTDLQSIDVGHYTEEEEKNGVGRLEKGLCTDMTLFCLIRPLTSKHRH